MRPFAEGLTRLPLDEFMTHANRVFTKIKNKIYNSFDELLARYIFPRNERIEEADSSVWQPVDYGRGLHWIDIGYFLNMIMFKKDMVLL